VRAGRVLAVLAAAILIPACGDDDDEGDVALTIINAGSVPVHAEVGYFDRNEQTFVTDEFDIAGGSSVVVRFWELQADVFVTRTSDGAVLFDEQLEFQDFTNDQATVTVTP
jgi:hypothetical protein